MFGGNKMTHIFLYGPPGSGKSTIGKLLASALDLHFIDLDIGIECVAGRTISQIMSTDEENFRDLESHELQRVTANMNAVIALGGGALLREGNRRHVEEHGQVVFLESNLSTLMTRLDEDNNQRPLLAGELQAKLEALLALRAEHYASFDLRVNVDNQFPVQIAWEIQKQLGRFHVRGIGAGYDVLLQANAIDHLGEILNARGVRGKIALVSDSNVAPIYGERVLESSRAAGYEAYLVVIPAGEDHKTLEIVSHLWKAFLDHGLDRKSTVVALGGGVVSDLTGFAASTFMRGVDWVSVPTTLLSMIDASLGGKTGFDLPEGKNLIGSFHPPRLALADTDILSTLPNAEFRSGLAEVVKHGVIADPELYDLCSHGMDAIKAHLSEIVRRAIAVKVKVIVEDPYERGFRAALNLGHTVGHAVELVSGFGLRHGEAVAVGMVAEARLAERLMVAGKGLSERIAESLSALGLPIHIPPELPRGELIRAMKLDKKKAAGVVHFALPVKIGEVKVGVEVKDLNLIFDNS